MSEFENENPYTMDPDRQVLEPEEETTANGRKKAVLLSLLGGMLLGALLVTVLGMTFVNLIMSRMDRCLVLGGNHPVVVDNEVLDQKTLDKLDEITSYISYYYNDEYELDDLRDEMFHAVVDGLGDPYSTYYTAQEYADMNIETGGVYYGIGAGLTQDKTTMVVTISKVYSGTPAEEAGLMKGDIIVSAEDIEATSVELSELVQHIRGEEGTKVHLLIVRDNKTMEFDVERRNVVLPSVEGQLLEDGMGYIQITEFQKKTAEQFKSILEDLQKQGMKGAIIDLRGNPGGLLTTVVDMLDYMLPEGLLVYVEDKQGNRQDFTSDASCVDLPLVVLVDGASASASEIFAGAMKDYEYATLVGTNTFGKGIVQTVFPLEDNDALKVTTAKYYTPKGNFIHKVGIAPDVEIEYEWLGDKDSTTYEMQYDNQLIKAKEVLQEKLK